MGEGSNIPNATESSVGAARPLPDVRGPRLSRSERREHLLDVAWALVLKGGLEAVTMEGVAAAAGVSKALGYTYFAHRGELMSELLRRELEILRTNGREQMAAAPTYEGTVRALVHAWFDYVADRGPLLTLLLNARKIDPDMDRYRYNWSRSLEDSTGDDLAKRFNIPVERARIAASVFFTGMFGLAERWVGGDDRELLEDTFARLVLSSLPALADDAPANSSASPPLG